MEGLEQSQPLIMGKELWLGFMRGSSPKPIKFHVMVMKNIHTTMAERQAPIDVTGIVPRDHPLRRIKTPLLQAQNSTVHGTGIFTRHLVARPANTVLASTVNKRDHAAGLFLGALINSSHMPQILAPVSLPALPSHDTRYIDDQLLEYNASRDESANVKIVRTGEHLEVISIKSIGEKTELLRGCPVTDWLVQVIKNPTTPCNTRQFLEGYLGAAMHVMGAENGRGPEWITPEDGLHLDSIGAQVVFRSTG